MTQCMYKQSHVDPLVGAIMMGTRSVLHGEGSANRGESQARVGLQPVTANWLASWAVKWITHAHYDTILNCSAVE